jgi:hypothetical protein
VTFYSPKPLPVQAFQLGVDPFPAWFLDRQSTGAVTIHGSSFEDPLSAATITNRYGITTAQRGDFIVLDITGLLYARTTADLLALCDPATSKR